MSMSDRAPVRFERRGAASWATIDRPESGNACSPEAIESLRGWIAGAPKEEGVRALVLTGAGGVFCLGADMRAGAAHLGEPDSLLAYVALGRELVADIASSELPVIAAVNGRALAGGFELVLAADLAIAVRSATLGDAHALHGITPGWGSSALLHRLAGPRAATYLLTTGAELSAEELERLGVLNAVVPDDALHDAVDALVAQLARVSPRTLGRMLALARSAGGPLADDLAAEWETLSEQVRDAEFTDGVKRFLGR